jgi:hypothetical protein
MIYREDRLRREIISTMDIYKAITLWFIETKREKFSRYPAVKFARRDIAEKVVNEIIIIDNVDVKEVIEVLSFALSNKFWQKQPKYMALNKLRELDEDGFSRYDKLLLAMERENDKQPFNSNENTQSYDTFGD